MKYILTLFCLVSFVAYGQEPAYTPMRLSYQFRTIKVDSLFLIPSFNDTTAANNSTMKNVAGAMIRTGNDFYMRNATTNAWLQNVNVGTGASPSIQFVDSVWRVAGKDSIFWRKGGTTNKIKDSTGGRVVDTIYRTVGKDSIFFKISGTTYKIKDSTVTDSPDRIDGTATANVTAAMATKNMLFSNVGKFQVSGTEFVVETTDATITSNNINFQSDGTAIEWKDTLNTLTSQVRTSYFSGDIDISNSDFQSYVPGFYTILPADNTGTYKFIFPNPGTYVGQSITILNKDATNDAYIGVNSGGIKYPDGTTVTRLNQLEAATFYDDGNDWRLVSLYP